MKLLIAFNKNLGNTLRNTCRPFASSHSCTKLPALCTEPLFVFFLTEKEKRRLWLNHVFEAAAAWTSGLVNILFSVEVEVVWSSIIPACAIKLLLTTTKMNMGQKQPASIDKPMVITALLYQAHGYEAWVWNCILVTCSALLNKNLTCFVWSLKYANKI